jgi:hypothetical protein
MVNPEVSQLFDGPPLKDGNHRAVESVDSDAWSRIDYLEDLHLPGLLFFVAQWIESKYQLISRKWSRAAQEWRLHSAFLMSWRRIPLRALLF